MPTLNATVHGQVQGVGFRWFVQRKAQELGLAGRAINQRDGTVRVVAEGEHGALMSLVRALAHGPAASHVERVDHEIERTERGLSGFEMGYGD